jgi:glycosyltransferase involved in cell wall biosynthesis
MKTTINPLVSVIVNCHNGEKFLKKCIKSILSQTYKKIEIIFWDNLSTDNSKAIIKSFHDNKIKYFKSKKFTSLYSARNSAIKKAKGEFIGFLDTDDWWSPSKIQKQINKYKKNRNIKFVYCNCYLFNQKTKNKKIFTKKKLPEGKITQNILNNYNIGLLTILVKKKLFLNQKFNLNYNIIGDFDFVIKLSKKIEFACVQEPLAYYRHHNKNYSTKNLSEYINELKYWFKKNKVILENEGYSLRSQSFLLKKLQFKSFLKHFTKLRIILGV